MTDRGTDIACETDADELFSTTDDSTEQDALHRILTDDVLGPGGDGWGFDVRRLLGLPQSQLAKYGPILSEVLTRDERIDSADVTLTATTHQGLAALIISVTCHRSNGTSFQFVKLVSALTIEDWEGQAA